jgi:hypothetical protein
MMVEEVHCAVPPVQRNDLAVLARNELLVIGSGCGTSCEERDDGAERCEAQKIS